MKINPFNSNQPIQNVSIQPKAEDNPTPNNPQQTNITPKSNVNENFNFNKEVKFNTINYYQQLLLIKELLKLPKEWMELMNWTFPEAKAVKTLKQLLSMKGQEIDIKELILLLQGNSKEALTKLLKLTTPSPENFQNIAQLKELVALLTKITPDNNTPANQLLNNIIPLYIPFIAPMQNLQTLQEFQEESNPKKSKDLALSAFMTTERLGRFKIYVYKKTAGLECLIENDYKEKETQDYVEKISSHIKKEACLSSIETSFNELKVKNDEKREIYIKQLVSPACDILTASFIVIKMLFALDEKIALLENRKAQI